MNPIETRFIDMLEQASGHDFFNKDEDGSLYTVIHTGRLIEAFNLRVLFEGDIVELITEVFLCAEKGRDENIRSLLDNLNTFCKNGRFFISDNRRISFALSLSINDLEQLNDPFEAVFYGCEIFEKYQDAILKALVGQSVFFTRWEA